MKRSTPSRGDLAAVRHLASSGLDVYAHNLETVDRLQALHLFILPQLIKMLGCLLSQNIDCQHAEDT